MPMIQCPLISTEHFVSNDRPAEGPAEWKIMNISTHISKNGNPMLKITYWVEDKNGRRSNLTEYLPLIEGSEWRIGRLASVTDTQDMVKEGRIDTDKWHHKRGYGIIKHEKTVGYEPKAVWARLSKEPIEIVADKPKEESEPKFKDDDIAF